MPYFADPSKDYFTSVTLHIVCDTAGAEIHYTLDGGTPDHGSPTPDASGRVAVTGIGTHVVRAIGTKEGMADSDEASKEFTIEARGGVCACIIDVLNVCVMFVSGFRMFCFFFFSLR